MDIGLGGAIHYMGIILVNFYGWVFFVALLVWILFELKKRSNIERYASAIKWIMLEIKVDELNERSAFAMEQVFAALHAVHANATWGEQFAGKIVLSLSCEIVSIGGKVSYMIRTPDRYRTLIESAVFAQYPKAEIYEVEDYLKNLPKEYEPEHDDFDFWGTQLNKIKQEAESCYPIRTFSGFEHSEQDTIIDPLADVLEVMSNIEPYELLASQIVIKPVPDKDPWKDGANKIVQKLKGTPEKGHKESFLVSILGEVLNGLFSIVGLGAEKKPEAKKDQPPSLMQYLSEGEKGVITAVERFLTKPCYEVHIRLLYLTPKGRLNKGLRIPEIIGAYRNFTDPTINGLKPDTSGTWTDAPFKVSQTLEQPILRKRILTRKRHFLANFKSRDSWKGSGHYFMNTEELATLYHFPQVPNARVSALSRVSTVKSAPPSNLPVG